MSETEIIRSVFAPLVRRAGAFGLTDDCASYVSGPSQELVVKTDPIREGVHFFADDPADAIAWKALAVNVSDLAAKAARPTAYLAAVSFPDAPSDAWLELFQTGLLRAQDAFGVSIIGGDTDRAPGPVTIAITVFGECPTGRMIRRGGARPGDLLYVSGVLGEAAVGLALHSGDISAPEGSAGASAAAVDRFLRPQPRIGLKAALRRCASGAMDISDGLAKDAGRMAIASGCGIEIDIALVPAAPLLVQLGIDKDRQSQMTLGHGDDYEVLASVPPDAAGTFEALANDGGVSVTRIGCVTSGSALILRDQNGRTVNLKSTGWEHF